MLSKEECEEALMNICSSNSKIKDRIVFNQLINEHFELIDLLKKHDIENLPIEELDKWFDRSLWHVNKVNELSKKTIELSRDINSKQERIDVLTTNPPLKFEELHDFMPVFDVTTGFWIMITSVNGNSFVGYVFNKKDEKLYVNLFIFEENRFYRREVNNDE